MSGKVIVAVFPSRDLLTNALDHITHMRDVVVKRAAVVAKATSGETIIFNDNVSANDGGFVGGVLGGVLGALVSAQQGALNMTTFDSTTALILGFILGMMIGAVLGWGIFHYWDLGNNAQRFNSVLPEVDAGRPTLILEIRRDHKMHARLLQELNLFEAEVLPNSA